MRDPYAVLGVKRDAGVDEIKSAWRSVAKASHPDHNPADPNASARFSEAGEAYEVLKDPERRNRYDQARRMAEGKNPEQTIQQQREAARQAAARATAAQANAQQVMEELMRASAARNSSPSPRRFARCSPTAPRAPARRPARCWLARKRPVV